NLQPERRPRAMGVDCPPAAQDERPRRLARRLVEPRYARGDRAEGTGRADDPRGESGNGSVAAAGGRPPPPRGEPGFLRAAGRRAGGGDGPAARRPGVVPPRRAHGVVARRAGPLLALSRRTAGTGRPSPGALLMPPSRRCSSNPSEFARGWLPGRSNKE